MPYTLPTPSTLEDVFKMNPGAFTQAQGFMQGGVQQNDQDLQSSQLKNMFDAQNNPLMLENQRGINQTRDAMLPGVVADSTSKGLKTQREQAGQDDAITLAKKKFLADASDEDMKQLYSEGQRMAYSDDPDTRARGLDILNHHKDMVEERLKNTNKLSQIRETGNQARLTDAQAIDAGKYKKGSGNSKSVEQGIIDAKSARERYQKLNDAATVASQANNEELADSYRARAEAIRPQAEAEIANTSARPGTADLAPLGITPVPNRSISPGSVKPADVPDASTFQKAFGSYEPDKYDYRIGPNGVPQRKPKGK